MFSRSRNHRARDYRLQGKTGFARNEGSLAGWNRGQLRIRTDACALVKRLDKLRAFSYKRSRQARCDPTRKSPGPGALAPA